MLLKLGGGEDIYKYKILYLENGMRVLLSTSDRVDKAAVSLSVKAGSLSDPEAFPGMAHFLEHMLFMGTETHPDENYYSEYIHLHGGSTNAETNYEVTNYYYDIDAQHLKESLDVFSGFFKCPLILENALARERVAVDNEHSNNILSESWRQHHLISLLSRKDTPMSKFLTGSEATLQHATRKDLLAFWSAMYRPSRMCLAVHGKESLEVLEEYVMNTFSQVREKQNCLGEEAGEGSTLGEMYTPPLYGEGNGSVSVPYYTLKEEVQRKVVMYRPAVNLNSDQSKLSITILLPSSVRTYRNKTMAYISSLLKGTGEDSLSGVLLLSGLAMDVSIDWETNSIQTVLSVNVSLTEDDPESIGLVCAMVKHALAQIRRKGTEEFYSMFKAIAEQSFESVESNDPIVHVKRATHEMHFYPVEEFMKHHYIWEKLDAEEFETYLSLAIDDTKWLLQYRTSNLPAESRITVDPIYGINYSIEEFPLVDVRRERDLLRKMKWAFVLPEVKNIKEIRETETSLSIGTIPVGVEALPEQAKEVSATLVEKEGCTAYLVHNKKFNLKEGRVIIYLETDQHMASAKAYTGFSGYMKAFVWFFQHKYKMEMKASQVIMSMDATHYCVKIGFEGPPLLIEDLVGKFFEEYMKKDEKYFGLARSNAISFFQKQIKLSPYRKIVSGLEKAMNYPVFDPYTCIEHAKNLSPEDICTITEASVKILGIGNITEKELGRIIATVEKHVKCTPKTFSLSLTKKNVFVPTEDMQNIAVSLVHVADAKDAKEQMKNTAITELISQIRSETFFDELRTQEKFGYIVYLRNFTIMKIPVILCTVQSTQEFSTIEARIKKFIAQTKEVIEALSPEQYQKHRDSAVTFVKEERATMSDYANDLMDAWRTSGFDLHHQQTLANEILSTTQEEVAEYAGKFFTKVLTIQAANNSKRTVSFDGTSLANTSVEIPT
ncbi:insulysin [Nematocida sp. AWRm77]|nr:insulysin [Nematocida sp. AWRm77]